MNIVDASFYCVNGHHECPVEDFGIFQLCHKCLDSRPKRYVAQFRGPEMLFATVPG